MPDLPKKRHRRAARNIVTRYLKVRVGENAVLEPYDHTQPVAAAMIDELRRAGGRTLLNLHTSGPNRSSFMNWVALADADGAIDGTSALRRGKFV